VPALLGKKARLDMPGYLTTARIINQDWFCPIYHSSLWIDNFLFDIERFVGHC
jgi:hypothetical protein